MGALGGAFLPIGDIHTLKEGRTNGAGYLAIRAVTCGRWHVGRAVLAYLLFGAATALQFQPPAMGMNVPSALLVVSPHVLAIPSVAGLVGRQTSPRALTTPSWGRRPRQGASGDRTRRLRVVAVRTPTPLIS